MVSFLEFLHKLLVVCDQPCEIIVLMVLHPHEGLVFLAAVALSKIDLLFDLMEVGCNVPWTHWVFARHLNEVAILHAIVEGPLTGKHS